MAPNGRASAVAAWRKDGAHAIENVQKTLQAKIDEQKRNVKAATKESHTHHLLAQRPLRKCEKLSDALSDHEK